MRHAFVFALSKGRLAGSSSRFEFPMETILAEIVHVEGGQKCSNPPSFLSRAMWYRVTKISIERSGSLVD